MAIADERDEAGGGEPGERGASGGTDITGGTDKVGRGGLANPDAPHASDKHVPKTNEPRAEETVETGDIMGASSTHAGAGGVMDNTGGTGTAPTGDTFFGGDDNG